MTKVPDGGQFELWWPGTGAVTLTDPGPSRALVMATFDREEFRTELDRRLADDPDADYMIVWGGGFDVYEITREQI